MLTPDLIRDVIEEKMWGLTRTVVAETLRGRADLYMIAPSVRDVDSIQSEFPKLTSIVANVATLVARTTRQHHLRYSVLIVSRPSFQSEASNTTRYGRVPLLNSRIPSLKT